MPAIRIEIRRQVSAQEEIAIMDAVHAAVRDSFKLLPGDKTVRLVAHLPHRLTCPPHLAHPELYTFISIDAFSGRSLDAKRALYAGIVANLEALGIPKDHVLILLRESAAENWGIRGGRAACDVDLGFKVDV